ncbi:2486_t:CDS:2 [Rhizophagus irregularis]|nr:2486_t:CDS:2 [Rhizophagus irregularis]
MSNNDAPLTLENWLDNGKIDKWLFYDVTFNNWKEYKYLILG